MYALEKIVQNADVYKLLEHYGFDTSQSQGTMLRSHCAIHGGNNKSAFAFNTDTGLWYCHTNPECGGGDIFTLVERMEGLSFADSTKWIANFFDIDIEGLDIIERKSQNQKEIAEFMKIMTRRKNKKDMDVYSPDVTLQEVSRYKNFKEETLSHFELYFVKEIELEKNGGGTYKMYNRLFFPIIYNNRKIGASLRATKQNDYPKWSHQPKEIKTSNIIYNYDAIKPGESVVICEGISDVWAYHEIGVVAGCTFGAHLTENQYRLLIKSGADIILSYDGDDAGRKATKKAIKMLRNKANIYLVQMNDGEDPENISREELMIRYGERRRV